MQGEGHGPRLAKGSRRKGRWLLFTVRDQVENGQGGPVAAAAALSLDLVLREAPSRVVAWKRRIASRFERLDLARDLGADIGSLHWFRGLGTMLGLGLLTLLASWPTPGAEAYLAPERETVARVAALEDAVALVPASAPVTVTNRVGAHLSARRTAARPGRAHDRDARGRRDGPGPGR